MLQFEFDRLSYRNFVIIYPTYRKNRLGFLRLNKLKIFLPNLLFLLYSDLIVSLAIRQCGARSSILIT